MSQIVIHGDTVYLAGQVANDSNADITVQTQQVWPKPVLTTARSSRPRSGSRAWVISHK
jgi:enamine deaminase RidA (YjgF/YER057c/UK114 family)